MEELTLTITPSNQEDFLNVLAAKVVEKGISEEMIQTIMDRVVEDIDYEDVASNVASEMDLEEIRNEIVNNIDYYMLADKVVDNLDTYSLASDVVDQIDYSELGDRIDIDQTINEKVEESIDDMSTSIHSRIDSFSGDLDHMNDIIISLKKRVAELEAKRGFFSRIFGG
jgi:S-adenosylmethionine synthetase